MVDVTQDLESNLHQFTGTENWFRHQLNRNMLYTDGVQYFAEKAGGGAYWLLDIIATELFPMQKDEPFMMIELRVDLDSKAVLTADDGDGKNLYTRVIEFTDCPVGVWRFYLTDNVLLLPSEY